MVISAEAVEDNSDSSGSDTGSDTGSAITGPQLSIDSATGEVTLAGEADYHVIPNYYFTVTADNGTETTSQDVGPVVADALVTSGSYQGTDNADVVHGDGSADVTSGSGEDVFVVALDEWSASAHTLTDFDSSSDTIDVSAALLAAGYTGISSAEGVEDNQLNQITNVSSDVDLISGMTAVWTMLLVAILMMLAMCLPYLLIQMLLQAQALSSRLRSQSVIVQPSRKTMSR